MISLLSWYIIHINNSSLLSIQPTKSIETIDVNMPKNTSNQKIVSNTKKVSSWSNEINIQENTNQDNTSQWNNSNDSFNEEIYEEIIFHDDFDKEYWNDVDNNYQDE